MSVLFFCDFNRNIQDQVSEADGTPYSGTLGSDDYEAFSDGRKGLTFAAADVRRVAWTGLTIASDQFLAYGCKIRKNVAFDGTATQRIMEISSSASNDQIGTWIELNASTDGILVRATDVGNSNSSRSLVVSDFLVAADDELSLACYYCPDPSEPSGDKRIFRCYVNGRCIFSENRSGTEFPTTGMSQIVIGADSGTLSSDSGCTIRDAWVIQNEHMQDWAFQRIHDEGFDANAITDSTIYRESYKIANYGRAEIDYPVNCVADGRLWGHDGTDVYYTDDETGFSGWTKFDTASPGTIQSVYAVGDYVFASVAGTLYRSTIASPSFSDVLTMTTGNYVVPGWGWTHRTDADGTVHLVIGEYLASTGESKIRYTDDYGGTWTTRYTSPSGNVHHIHCVRYDDSGGRLWANRGDTVDNMGYSDDDGANWTWLLDEANHTNQFLQIAESSRVQMAVIDDLVGSLGVAWRRDLEDYQTQYDSNGFDNSWHYVGAFGGDAYAAYPWTVLRLPNDFFLIYAYHVSAGQHSSIYIADRTGQVVVRAEDIGLNTYLGAGHSAACVSSRRAFIGKHSFPLTISLRGAKLPEFSQFFMIPTKRKYLLTE